MVRLSLLLRRFTRRAARPAGEATTPSPLPKKTALIVRLDGWTYTPLAQQLERSGWRVQVVDGGFAALNALARTTPDLLVVTGPADVPLYGTLRSATKAPILVLAAQTDEATTLAAFAAGVDQFQALPISCEEAAARALALARRGTAGSFRPGLILTDS